MRVTTSQYETISKNQICLACVAGVERGRGAFLPPPLPPVFAPATQAKFAQLKRFSPEHNLPITEKNSLQQAAFWHDVKVVCCLLTSLLY